MPAEGERYKHKQITDVTYAVTAVNLSQKILWLEDTKVPGSFKVTFTQLKNNYKRI